MTNKTDMAGLIWSAN